MSVNQIKSHEGESTVNRTKQFGPLVVFLILVLASLLSVSAQSRQAKRHVDVPAITPRPEDVGTLDGIIRAFYDVISGPAGAPRQWSRDRTLYIPEIKFVQVSRKNGKVTSEVMDHQTYVDGSDSAMVKHGFYEREIHRVVQSFGDITHVFSTYESRTTFDGPVIARGINSIELINDGKRWWITFAQWSDETPDSPIPP